MAVRQTFRRRENLPRIPQRHGDDQSRRWRFPHYGGNDRFFRLCRRSERCIARLQNLDPLLGYRTFGFPERWHRLRSRRFQGKVFNFFFFFCEYISSSILMWQATVDIFKKTVTLDKFDIKQIGHIDTDIKGLGIFNWLAEAVSDMISTTNGMISTLLFLFHSDCQLGHQLDQRSHQRTYWRSHQRDYPTDSWRLDSSYCCPVLLCFALKCYHLTILQNCHYYSILLCDKHVINQSFIEIEIVILQANNQIKISSVKVTSGPLISTFSNCLI